MAISVAVRSVSSMRSSSAEVLIQMGFVSFSDVGGIGACCSNILVGYDICVISCRYGWFALHGLARWIYQRKIHTMENRCCYLHFDTNVREELVRCICA